MMTESNEDVVFFDPQLFINKNYVTKIFDFPNALPLNLELLESASTDFDLTGQVVWPAAKLLCSYLCAIRQQLPDVRVLELGAGVGLAGLLAARFGAHVVLSDGNEEVVALLQRNAFRNFPDGSVSMLQSLHDEYQLLPLVAAAVRLDWSETASIDRLREAFPQGFDLIIGSDIVFWQASVPSLFSGAIAPLLRTQSQTFPPAFVLCYQSRALAGDALVDQSAKEAELSVEVLAPQQFMPQQLPSPHLRLLRYYRKEARTENAMT